MNKLLSLEHKPDAVFCASDSIAIGALQAALKSGCTVPQEIGIIGVGNHRYGEYVRVPLSTVDQKQTDIGEKAASLLLDLIRQRKDSGHRFILIEPELGRPRIESEISWQRRCPYRWISQLRLARWCDAEP